MKKLLLLVFLISISCQVDRDEYYVKYSIDSSTVYIGGKIDLFITNEEGIQSEITVNQRELYEVTIGPVSRGFSSYMLARDAGSNSNLKLYANIYVSKNNGPFALKANDGSDAPRSSVSLEYSIDF